MEDILMAKWRIEVRETITSVWYIEANDIQTVEAIYRDCGVQGEPSEQLYEDGYKILLVKRPEY